MKKSYARSGSASIDERRQRGDLPDDSFDEREIVVSATECTGLAPAVTDMDNEISAQTNEARLYAVHAPLGDAAPNDTEDEHNGSKRNKREKSKEEKREGDVH